MTRPNVLIFAGSDPCGGAGLQADNLAVAALGAHPLTVVTALTVQDNDRVYAVQPVSPDLVRQQAQALIDKMDIAVVKIGIAGSLANAEAIAGLLREMRRRRPDLQVVLDPVLASGHGDALSTDSPLQAVRMLLPLASLVTPNIPEAIKLCDGATQPHEQAGMLLQSCPHVLIKGGHGDDAEVTNRWFNMAQQREWRWPRLPGEFHGSGCTLASAIAALLAAGEPMAAALEGGQAYCNKALLSAYAIAKGQRMPNRNITLEKCK